MKREIYKQIEIPEGVTVQIAEGKINLKGPAGENTRTFETQGLEFKINGKEILIGDKKATKNEKKRIHTIAAHIENLIKGVKEKFMYKMKICYHHFPMTIEIKGNKAFIKNYLGEKIPRVANIIPGTEIKVEKEIITITSVDKELAGQTAANLETATKVNDKRDRRVFQDGIYITSKAGKLI